MATFQPGKIPAARREIIHKLVGGGCGGEMAALPVISPERQNGRSKSPARITPRAT